MRPVPATRVLLAIASIVCASALARAQSSSGVIEIGPDAEASSPAGPSQTPPPDTAPDQALPALDDNAWRVRFVELLWDNDGAYIKPFNESDRHYTNANRLNIALDPSARFQDAVRDLADRVLPMEGARVAAGVSVAQHIYTSSDIEVADPPLTDRPYAGYLYAGFLVQRTNGRVHDHVELDVGVVGQNSGAQAVQTFIHSAFPGQVQPLGWDTQLASELAINARLQRSWRFEKATIARLELDAIPRVSVDLGNVFVRASADATVRLGYNLPDEFGPSRILDTVDATRSWGGTWGVYGYARFGARAVAHNIFLDGNTFAGSRSVDKRTVVGEMSFGIAARYKWFEMGYATTWSAEEFETQPNADAFASLYARVTINF